MLTYPSFSRKPKDPNTLFQISDTSDIIRRVDEQNRAKTTEALAPVVANAPVADATIKTTAAADQTLKSASQTMNKVSAGVGMAATLGGGLLAASGQKTIDSGDNSNLKNAYMKKGIGQGVSMGAGIGSSFGPVGTLVGAGVGAIGGLIYGKTAGDKAQIEADKQKKIELDKYNKALAASKRQINISNDINNYNSLLDSYNEFSKVPQYMSGGLIKYKTITDDALQQLKCHLDECKLLIDEKLKEIVESKENLKPNDNHIPTFKRGGVLATLKKNIILDGPSHEEENNTGVKGDNGLPVVHGNYKVAEIESHELVMHDEPMSAIEKLVSEVKNTKDEAKKIELGKLIVAELKFNTHDYTDLTNELKV